MSLREAIGDAGEWPPLPHDPHRSCDTLRVRTLLMLSSRR